jgi:Zn-dependent protease
MLLSLVAFVIAFGALLLLERLAHRMLQEVALLVTGHADVAVFLYSIPLLPGVALHELSHAVMARLLGVKVRSLTLIPQRQKGGAVRLGAVEVLRSDNLRASLIGGAPLLSGLVALGLIGWLAFNGAALTSAIEKGDVNALAAQLIATTRVADALVWFYLIFAVANSMMPSASDTQAWPPVIGVMAVIVGVVVVIGGAGVVQTLKAPLSFTLRWLAAALAITACVDVAVIGILWMLARLLERISNRRIEYK